ncbi:corticotropin-releasing factor-binding protein-like isoform X3 [Ptychodera flava]|uniref:corticotropin-releasing factor-binding protein-like isoform X3 n=1 Tax=Ptychodera flava TaxID=63121 RepID=UPI00396A71AA
MVKYLPLAAFICCSLSVSLSAPYKDSMPLFPIKRTSTSNKLDCVDVVSVEGEYYFISDGLTSQCTTFLMADADELITIEFQHIDEELRCGDLSEQWLAFIDGWYFKGTIYPHEEENTGLDYDRLYYASCTDIRSVHRSSQNVAQLNFKIPTPGKMFNFTFKKDKANKMCDVIIALSSSGTYTLKNYGERINCSMMVLSATTLKISNMKIAYSDNERVTKCGGGDFLQFQQRANATTTHLKEMTRVCGVTDNHVKVKGRLDMTWNTKCGINQEEGTAPAQMSSKKRSPLEVLVGQMLREDDVEREQCYDQADLSVTLTCYYAVVRLVSSGNYDNEVTLEYNRIPIDPTCSADQW